MQISELLLYGLLIAAVIGFNLLMQALARRHRQQPAPDSSETQHDADSGVLAGEAGSGWGRVPAAEELVGATTKALSRTERAPTPPGLRAPSVYQRRRRERLFRDRDDLRRAVVTMTVLGPCRARQPYGQDPTAPS